MTLLRAPRWAIALAFSQVAVVFWQASSSATYLPIARFMRDTYVTAVHWFLKLTVGTILPAFHTFLMNHPPTVRQAESAISFTLLLPLFYFLFGFVERAIVPSSAPKQSWDERLRHAPTWLLAIVGSHVIVTMWQLLSTSYLWLAKWVEYIYLDQVQSLILFLASSWMPAIKNFFESRPLEVDHAVHVISGVLVFPMVYGIIMFLRGDFKQWIYFLGLKD
jgi:hypothetical protein